MLHVYMSVHLLLDEKSTATTTKLLSYGKDCILKFTNDLNLCEKGRFFFWKSCAIEKHQILNISKVDPTYKRKMPENYCFA